MNFSEIVFNKNILKMFSNSQETFKKITEKKEEIKKQIANMNPTVFISIIASFIIIFIIFVLTIIFIVQPEFFRKIFN
jgi:hypothetical protein